MRQTLKGIVSALPEGAQRPIRRLTHLARGLPYYGSGRWCPVCDRSSRRFTAAGVVPRPDAGCFHCGAVERHRFVWLYFARQTDLFDGAPKKMLHVAPEEAFQEPLRKHLGDGYLTADLDGTRAMVRMDVTDIRYPDRTFDVIYCSHVLEHVSDDRRAMREFRRVLKDDGWAILLVPITVDVTFEDPAVVTPEDRLRAFGQSDHVRSYGADYIDRLQESGFDVTRTTVLGMFDAGECARMGLNAKAGEIFHCVKKRAPGQTGSPT